MFLEENSQCAFLTSLVRWFLTSIPQLKRRAYHLLSAISLLHSNEGPALETSALQFFYGSKLSSWTHLMKLNLNFCVYPPNRLGRPRFLSDPNVQMSLCLAQAQPPGGYSWEFLVGVCRPALQILTVFQTKIFDYSHPFSDLASHENLYPFSDPAPKKLCHHYLD